MGVWRVFNGCGNEWVCKECSMDVAVNVGVWRVFIRRRVVSGRSVIDGRCGERTSG